MTSKETYMLAEGLFIRAWANDPKAEPYTNWSSSWPTIWPATFFDCLLAPFARGNTGGPANRTSRGDGVRFHVSLLVSTLRYSG